MTIDPDLLSYYQTLAHAFPLPPAADGLARRRRFAEIAARFRAPRPEGLDVEDIAIPLAGRTLAARLYRPRAASGTRLPLMVYFHGGGWVVGDIETHDGAVAQLALDTGAAICSVAYRLAPEHPYPVPAQDALDAIMWLAEHRVRLGFTPDTLAVGGDSAGAHLAAGAARVANTKVPGLVRAQCLIYPVVSPRMNTASYRDLVAEPGLTPADMAYYWGEFLAGKTIAADDTCVDLMATPPVRLPADAVVIVAGHDPLHDEGRDYARFLALHGASVELIEAHDMTHGFVRLQQQSPAARAWMVRAAQALRAIWP